jgi:hypothetical protein
LAKQGRADDTAPWPEVHIVKEIPGVGAEREAEAPIVGCSPAAEDTAAQAAWAKATAAPAATTAATTATTTPAAKPAAAPSTPTTRC